MLLAKLFMVADRVAKPRGNGLSGALLSVKDFELLLQRERARSDRNGDPFSLLVFTAGRRQSARATMTHLAVTLRRRLRITDQAGWLDNERIGVFLPSTRAQGAWVVAGDVVDMLPPKVAPPSCSVYCYPSDEPDEEMSAVTDDDFAEPEDSDVPVGAAETLFERRMPVWKRATDITVSAVALVLLSPLFMLIALAVKMSSPGPVFFKQCRTGRGGRPFGLYKFRSMAVDADDLKGELMELNEQDGPAFKISDDPRVTSVGRLLRRTSLDELPQFWNVLKGEMSLVGPRPLPCEETAECERWHRRRLDVTPGLTCFWQTSDRTTVSFNEWMRMDVRYMKSLSLWRDIQLILATVLVMFRGNRW